MNKIKIGKRKILSEMRNMKIETKKAQTAFLVLRGESSFL